MHYTKLGIITALPILFGSFVVNAQNDPKHSFPTENASRSVTENITQQALTEIEPEEDIYRGTVFGAEQKSYPSTILGQRPPTKKLLYDTSLVHAVKSGDADRIKTLLYANVDVNEKNYAGITPLTIAAEKGNLNILQLLVERGKADVNNPSSYGITPLIAAVSAGQTKAVEYLLAHGASAAAKDDLGKTALLYAVKFNDPQMLSILAKADKRAIDVADRTGNTPIIYATQKGYTENVKSLIKYGADVNDRNALTGLTALATASAEGHTDLIKLLVKKYKADVNLADLEGRTPIFYAIEKNQPESLRMLLSLKADPTQTDSQGVTPLMQAVSLNRQDCIDQLMRNKKTDIHATDNNGRNAVSYSVYARSISPLEQLLDAHVDMDTPDNDGNTPLMHAIQAKNDGAAILLLRQGANKNHANKQGQTPATLTAQFLPRSGTARMLGLKTTQTQE